MIKLIQNYGLKLIIFLTILMGVLAVLNIWGLVSLKLSYWKIVSTYLVIVVTLGIVIAASRDETSEREMRKDKFLD